MLEITMKIKKRNSCVVKCCIAVVVVIVLDICGVFLYLFELDYEKYFHYPMEGNILEYARARQQQDWKGSAVTSTITKLQQLPQPINWYNYTWLHLRNCDNLNSGNNVGLPQFTLLIKSALPNVKKRQAIRRSWGNEQRFSDIIIRRVFVLGTTLISSLANEIDLEADKYGDIIQGNFIDAYYNNTRKTLLAIRWVVELCPHSQYYVFIDDDYYLAMKNLLRFLANPSYYPEYYIPLNSIWSERLAEKRIENLYVGHVIKSRPLRYKFSKWYVPLKEYPFNRWPPYITAGVFVVSHATLLDLYYVSLYTQHFRFDDIFLGLVAAKGNIVLSHCDHFHFERPEYDKKTGSYRHVIAAHGFDDPDEMERIWNECRSAGMA